MKNYQIEVAIKANNCKKWQKNTKRLIGEERLYSAENRRRKNADIV